MPLGSKTDVMVCADDVNLLGNNINTTKNSTEAVIGTSNEGGLEVNT
jgi:hypothetical protein